MWSEGDRKNAMPARVVAQQRKFWHVVGAFGKCLAEASGKLLLAAVEGAEWPAVGDWVLVELRGTGAVALIRAVLPRRNCFIRKSPGKKIEEQAASTQALLQKGRPFIIASGDRTSDC
jgi:ribosome biogenesis GTPase